MTTDCVQKQSDHAEGGRLFDAEPDRQRVARRWRQRVPEAHLRLGHQHERHVTAGRGSAQDTSPKLRTATTTVHHKEQAVNLPISTSHVFQRCKYSVLYTTHKYIGAYISLPANPLPQLFCHNTITDCIPGSCHAHIFIGQATATNKDCYTGVAVINIHAVAGQIKHHPFKVFIFKGPTSNY